MANEFKPEVGSQISKLDAEQRIRDYQKLNPGKTKSVFYGRYALEAILSDKSVTGISFFFCRKKNQDGAEYDDLVLVGTRLDGTLAWTSDPPQKDANGGGGSGIYDNSIPCPPTCPNTGG